MIRAGDAARGLCDAGPFFQEGTTVEERAGFEGLVLLVFFILLCLSVISVMRRR